MRYRWWLALAVFLFAVGIMLGFSAQTEDATVFPGGLLDIAPSPTPHTEASPRATLDAFRDLAQFVVSLPPWAVFAFILGKNAIAVAASFIMGPFFLLVPLFSLVFNGWVIGVVADGVIAEQSVVYLLKGLLPHGIIELPAFFMAQAAALGFGIAAMQAVLRPERRSQLMPALRSNLKYLVIALILLVPAAAIEAFVTPLLLK